MRLFLDTSVLLAAAGSVNGSSHALFSRAAAQPRGEKQEKLLLLLRRQRVRGGFNLSKRAHAGHVSMTPVNGSSALSNPRCRIYLDVRHDLAASGLGEDVGHRNRSPTGLRTRTGTAEPGQKV